MSSYRKRRKRKLRPAAIAVVVVILCAAAAGVYLIAGHPFMAWRKTQAQPSSSEASTQSTEASSQADTSILMLVNKTHSMPSGYVPEMTQIAAKYYIQSGVDFRLDSRAATYMVSMLDAARKDGVNIGMVCGYRSSQTQTQLFDNKVQRLLSSGVASASVSSQAALAVAPPGYSEHETGLCADLAYNGKSDLEATFESSPAFTWLNAHASEYGFILRYPKDKTDVTKYEYEPWHYRFVGVDNAKRIKADGLCLEEYLEQLGSSPKTSSQKTVSSKTSSK